MPISVCRIEAFTRRTERLSAHPIGLVLFILAIGLFSFVGFSSADYNLEFIYSFTGTNNDGANPSSGLITDHNGVLYGTAGGGANYQGTVFSLTPPSIAADPWTESILYDFASSTNPLGYNTPAAGLAINKNGVLYGTTLEGGSQASCIVSGVKGCGAIFSLTPPVIAGGKWTLSILHAFNAYDNNGAFPDASLAIGKNGVLYGTTLLGGGASCGGSYCGTVFSLTPPSVAGGSWTESVLYRFATFGPSELNSRPVAGVIIGKNGALYGVTPSGGTNNNGTVFSLIPPSRSSDLWRKNIIYAFAGGSDGDYPQGGLVLDKNGVLYGTTEVGGAVNQPPCPGTVGCGTVFTLTPPATAGGVWTKDLIYAFTGNYTDGIAPESSLALDRNGVVYGTTSAGSNGGAGVYGSAFSLTPPATPGGAWTETDLHTFTSTDGYTASSLLPYKGAILGTIQSSGRYSGGTGGVFALVP